jgi:hypothetical protein
VSGRVVVLLAWAACAAAAPARAQSILNAAGIGLPLEALDGRARAMGSFGVGLQGSTLAPADPAASSRVLVSTGIIAVQPSWVRLTEHATDERTYFKGTRFPLLALGYPVRGGMAMLHAASAFDQGYRGERSVEVVLGGTTVPATDLFTQRGSVSTLALGYSRVVVPGTSVGITVGRYTGTIVRSLVRQYESSPGGGTIEPYRSVGTWRYSGFSLTGGVATDVRGIARVAASATWSADLEADATGATEGSDRSFEVPLQLRVGASSVLVPGLTLSASAVHADWSGTGSDLGSAGRAGSVTGVGVGLELSRARLLGRAAPLRLGFRRAGLPFSLDEEPATERVFSAGLGLVLSESEGVVLAAADLALEKGLRSGGGFSEDFWRATVSLRLSGF